ncbi:hypothetical protein KYB31_09645, partial [Clostridium felsineum]|uniref:thioesterase domain-containing protein n=1 Tax=Clostridium felsineum TaxID=36839 RepID=UPI00214D9D8F
RVWSEILGIEKLGVNDNFFDLGGYSLKAIALISRVNKEFNIEISVKELFSLPTIKEFSRCVYESKKSALKYENIVLLKRSNKNSNESVVNLFIIHDGSGDVGGYIEIASKLKDNINCWGIKIDKSVVYNTKTATIEQIAESYVKIIKSIQPNGNYNIAGWSLGGIIAFEMARQLEENNIKIQNLILIDSYINFDNEAVQNDFSLEREKAIIDEYVDDFQLHKKIIEKKTLEDVWKTAIEYLNERDINIIKSKFPQEITKIVPNYDDIELDKLIYSINSIRRLISAEKVYKPSCKIKKQAIYYKAKKNESNTNNWNYYFQKNMHVKEVDGDHYNIVKDNNAEYLAKEFNEIL